MADEIRQPMPLKTTMTAEEIVAEPGLTQGGQGIHPVQSVGPTGVVLTQRAAMVLGGIALISIIAFLWVEKPGDPRTWFSPWFNAFNMLMLLFACAIPFAVTTSYVYLMGPEKNNRLALQFKNLPLSERDFVLLTTHTMFSYQRYLGGIIATTTVTFLGAVALLFFKPVMAGDGMSFANGGNVLLMGVDVMRQPVDGGWQVSERLGNSIAAFSFGFIGAWLYFVSELTRSFFNCDLRPRILIAGTIRIATASVLALVVGFAFGGVLGDVEVFGGGKANSLELIEIVGFIIGYFPRRGLGFLNGVAGYISLIGKGEDYQSMPLRTLPGMSYSHVERLRQEGIDAVENLAGHHPVALTLQTGFPYPVVETWVGEAWLRRVLGDEGHKALAEKTGLHGKYELRRMAWELAREGEGEATKAKAAAALETLLVDAMGDGEAARMKTLSRMCLHFDDWGGEN